MDHTGIPEADLVLDEDNITPDAPYYYLTELAAKCTAKRMVPDYISAKKMRELKGDVYTCMGCRSFLTPDRSYVKGNLANAGTTGKASASIMAASIRRCDGQPR